MTSLYSGQVCGQIIISSNNTKLSNFKKITITIFNLDLLPSLINFLEQAEMKKYTKKFEQGKLKFIILWLIADSFYG
jgi:exonuclease V gamma subunit